MKRKSIGKTDATELIIAVGLVWGHLNARQFDEARQLAKGCLCLWPGNKDLTLMATHAAAEIPEPMNKSALVNNPVWTGDPVPHLRALKKMLIERSAMLLGDDRSECQAAIALVERAVQLRLRWLQMRRSDARLVIDMVEKLARKSEAEPVGKPEASEK